jgi:hypothetical protein
MEKPMPLVHHKLPLIPFSYAFLTKKTIYKSHGVVKIIAYKITQNHQSFQIKIS